MSGANGQDQAFVDAPTPAQLQRLRMIREDFHTLYYGHNVKGGRWLGVETWKCPLDLWIYQEIITERRPALIVETGSAFGGSALYMATICDMLGLETKIISIDVNPLPAPINHPRITWLTGSSTDLAVLRKVNAAAGVARRWFNCMVVLDSDHSQAHVAVELEAYSSLVSKGDYLIVEDTNVNGHPVYPEHGPGPWEAVGDFLTGHPEFSIDVGRERFLLSFNPGGYLVRTR